MRKRQHHSMKTTSFERGCVVSYRWRYQRARARALANALVPVGAEVVARLDMAPCGKNGVTADVRKGFISLHWVEVAHA